MSLSSMRYPVNCKITGVPWAQIMKAALYLVQAENGTPVSECMYKGWCSHLVDYCSPGTCLRYLVSAM